MTCGVRQGGILSPILSNLYVDELTDLLRNSGNGCFVNTTFVGCIMYADDLLLLSPSLRRMQSMLGLNICTRFGMSRNIVFNVQKLYDLVRVMSCLEVTPCIQVMRQCLM